MNATPPRWRWVLGVVLALCAGAAAADPLTIIGTVLTKIGVTAAWVTAAKVAFVVATLAYGESRRRKASRAMDAARQAHNANLQDRTINVLSTAAPWQIIYGQCEVGGSIEGILTSGDTDQFKHLVIVWAAHACTSIEDVKINGVSLGTLDGNGYVTAGKWWREQTAVHSEKVTFDGSGQATLANADAQLMAVIKDVGTAWNENFEPEPETRYDGVTVAGTTLSGGPPGIACVVTYTLQGDYALVRVKHHLGDPDQVADATLLAECPADWSASDRLRGLTYSVIRLALKEPEFQGGPPAITVVVKGKALYDHRTGLTAWSDNAALATADYLRATYGKDARYNQMHWDSVDAAANVCDETIMVGDWSGPRYTCNGAFKTDQDTDSVLEDLLGAMAGWADGGAGWRVGAGAWTAPVTTLTDDDNAGPVELAGGDGLDQLFNGVRGQFQDPARYGVGTDYTPYQNAAFVTADGREMWTDIGLPFTNHQQRATNLARIAVESARGEVLSYPAKMAVVQRLRVGERAVVNLPTLAINGGIYRLVKRDETPGGIVHLTLRQDAEANYDLADAAAPLPSTSGLPDPYIVPPVSGLTAESGEAWALVAAGGGVLPRILVAVIVAPELLSDRLQIEWRPSNTLEWQTWLAPTGGRALFIEPVSLGTTYFIRARWMRLVDGREVFGDWRVTSCVASAKSTPPPAFDVFGVVALADGTRELSFGYTTTPQPVDYRGAEIRYIAGTVPSPDWDLMTSMSSNGTLFTTSPALSGLPTAAGAWTFAARARDSHGLSTMLVVTETLPATGSDYVGDTTAPPTPTSFGGLASITYIWLNHSNPTYTQGHGHLETVIYGVRFMGVLPVFADALPVMRFSGIAAHFPVPPGEQWHFWAKWRSKDGIESVVPAGGTNGLTLTTGKIGNVNLGPLIVEAANLANNAVTEVKIDNYQITAPKMAANSIAVGSLAVQNGAIVDAMIQNLDGGKINAVSINTGSIVVGAATVAAAAGTGTGSTYIPTSQTSVDSGVIPIVSLTSTGSLVTVPGFAKVKVGLLSTNVDLFNFIVYLTVDGGVVHTYSISSPPYASASGSQVSEVILPILHTFSPSAGSHSYGYRAIVQFVDVTGAPVAANSIGYWQSTCEIKSGENKV